jgi:superfamily I DNA and/or RNA helicase
MREAATNLVLLGDPQQLEQPQKASHPEGSELSALQYLLEGHETMLEERGLFLGETWRLHPSICRYTSDLFYEGKLQPHAGLSAQAVVGPTRFAGAGLFPSSTKATRTSPSRRWPRSSISCGTSCSQESNGPNVTAKRGP